MSSHGIHGLRAMLWNCTDLTCPMWTRYEDLSDKDGTHRHQRRPMTVFATGELTTRDKLLRRYQLSVPSIQPATANTSASPWGKPSTCSPSGRPPSSSTGRLTP